MSLVNTLAKVAIGMAIAKGAKSVLGGGAAGGQGGGLADALGGALGGSGGLGGLLQNGMPQQSGGGLGGLLGGAGGQAGGLGGALGGLLGGAGGQAGGNPLESLIGAATGQGGSPLGQAGGLGGLMGALGGGAAAGGLGGLLTQAMTPGAALERQPSQDEEDAAAVMIGAMLSAAKSDGQIDANEEGALMKALGDLDANERQIINEELNKPVDPAALAARVPQGMEAQTYMMSLMAIDLDSQAEAQYLHSLAGEMGLPKEGVNQIHQQLGLPALYT